MIRGTDHEGNSYKMINWKLEGQKASNDEWILLDQKSNETFNRKEVKTFDAICNEKLKAIKLTQIGKNGSENYHMISNAFDVFGTLFD